MPWALLSLTSLAMGCAKTPVRIPSGPHLLIPNGLTARVEGSILRLEPDTTNTERCAIELQMDDGQVPPVTPGNGSRVRFARPWNHGFVFLTYCPDQTALSETEIKNILWNNLSP